MKKINLIIGLIVLVIVSNCTLHLGDFKKPKEIMNWIYKNIDYKVTLDRVKSPAETLNTGQGDCADMTALFAQMCADHLQIYPYGVFLKNKKDKNDLHRVAMISKQYYDCTGNYTADKKYIKAYFEIVKVLEYWELW